MKFWPARASGRLGTMLSSNSRFIASRKVIASWNGSQRVIVAIVFLLTVLCLC